MAGKTDTFELKRTSADRLWRACVQVIGLLGYTVINSDRASGQLSFSAGRSMSSWAGLDLTATVSAAERGSKLVMGTSIAKGRNTVGEGSQIGSWDEKNRLIKKFVDTVIEVLPTVPEVKAPRDNQVSKASQIADELTKLAKLRNEGVLTPNEFAARKAKLLG